MILRYEPGDATAVVRRSTIVMLSRTAPRDLALRLWECLPDGAGIVEALEAVEAASGVGLRDLPPFAIVSVEGSRAQIAVRGDLTVSVDVAEDGGTQRCAVDGADVTTWTERVFADVVELAVRADGPRPEGSLVDDTGSWPVFGGIVPADGIALRPDDLAPEVWSGSRAEAADAEAADEEAAGAEDSTGPEDAARDEAGVDSLETGGGPEGGTGSSEEDDAPAIGSLRYEGGAHAETEAPLGLSGFDESRRMALNGAAHAVAGGTSEEHSSVAVADPPVDVATTAEESAIGDSLPGARAHRPATAVFTVPDLAAEPQADQAVPAAEAEESAADVATEPVTDDETPLVADLTAEPAAAEQAADLAAEPATVDLAAEQAADLAAEPAAVDQAAPEAASGEGSDGQATAEIPQPSGTDGNFDGMWGQTVTDPPLGVAPLPTEPPAVPHPEQAAAPGDDDLDHDGDTVTTATLDKYRAVEPQTPAAESSTATAGEQVLARVCGLGHPNPPERDVCADCGEPLSNDPQYVKRPALGRLRFSSGQVIELDRGVIAGRRPRTTRGQGPDMPYLVTVASPQQDISRSHVEVFLDGWKVQVADLATTNGTTLIRPGQPAAQLRPNERVSVSAGDIVDLGDGVTMTFEGLL